MKKYKIENMPKIALGTWEITDEKVIDQIIKVALDSGYNHIDTAQAYFNEEHIGKTLKSIGIPRENYWITTKVFPKNFKYHTLESLKHSLKRLQTEYVDTILLHSSLGYEINAIAYKELIKAREMGLVRTIGVSNFSIDDLEGIKKATGEYPQYNQIVVSVKQRLVKLEEFCKNNNIKLMGYSTIRPYYNPNHFYPNSGLTEDEKKVVDQIAEKHNTTPALVLLRWAYNLDYVILPKSSNPKRVVENLNVKDIELEKEDMDKLNGLTSFKDEEFKQVMEMWKNMMKMTEEDMKIGLRISPESEKSPF